MTKTINSNKQANANGKRTKKNTTCMLITKSFFFFSSLSHFVVLKFNFVFNLRKEFLFEAEDSSI